MTVWIYVDTSKQVGDPAHLKVFASEDHANAWFDDHDPEGVAFEYRVIGEPRMIRRPVPNKNAPPEVRGGARAE